MIGARARRRRRRGGRARSHRVGRRRCTRRRRAARSRIRSPPCRRARIPPRCSGRTSTSLRRIELGDVVAVAEHRARSGCASWPRRAARRRPGSTSPATRNVPSREAGERSQASSAKCRPLRTAATPTNSIVRPRSAGRAARRRVERLLVVAVDVTDELLARRRPGRGTSGRRTPTGRAARRRARTRAPRARAPSRCTRARGRAAAHAEPLALVADDLVGEARVGVRPLEHGRDAEPPRVLERRERAERPRVDEVDLAGERRQPAGDDPVVQHQRPQLAEQPGTGTRTRPRASVGRPRTPSGSGPCDRRRVDACTSAPAACEAGDLLPGRVADPPGADPVREAVEDADRSHAPFTPHHPTVAALSRRLGTGRAARRRWRVRYGVRVREPASTSSSSPTTARDAAAPRASSRSRVADVHVIVVDSASTRRHARHESPTCRSTAIALAENRGFAHACNVGWRRGRGAVRPVPQPRRDASTAPRCERLVAVADERSGAIGAVAPRIVEPDGALDFSLRRFPRLRSTYAQALFLHRLFPQARLDRRARARPGRLRARRRRRTGSPAPACSSGARCSSSSTASTKASSSTARTSTSAGGSATRGLDVRFEPDAVVVHEGGASAPRAALLPVLAASRVRYAAKHQPAARRAARAGRYRARAR